MSLAIQENFESASTSENVTWFELYWYSEKIGRFSYGSRKEWQPAKGYEDLFIMNEENQLPCFLDNINPEGWLKDALGVEKQVDYISRGLRFLSNFVIVKEGETAACVVDDELLSDLDAHLSEDGVFQGVYDGVSGLSGEEGHDDALAENWDNRHMPRLSGAEQKLFMTLYPCGTMQPAKKTSFTHFAKYPGIDGYESLGVNEFLSMKMCDEAGLNTPQYALIEQGDQPPIFCVQRFDIPQEDHDGSERILMQDFCTILQKPSEIKFHGSIEQVFKALRGHSDAYSPERTQDNMQALFDRYVASWIMNDGDLHLKNMSALFRVDTETNAIKSVEFAPVYDPTIDTFKASGGVGSALSLGGSKKERRKLKDFVNLAKAQKLFCDENGNFQQEQAEQHIIRMAESMANTAIDFYNNPPAIAGITPTVKQDVAFMVSHVVERARMIGAQRLEWDVQQHWDAFKEHSPAKRYERAMGIVDSRGRKIPVSRRPR